MSDLDFVVKSYKGTYKVRYLKSRALVDGISNLGQRCFLLVDSRVRELWGSDLGPAFEFHPVAVIEASEKVKALEAIPAIIAELSQLGVRRGDTLVAIGGGVVQDITCFIAAVMYRGLEWVYIPTTLLAQADSCIGSKSSINVAGIKNLVGTFTPPREVILDTTFIKTLEPVDVHSGIGEMLKVHAIAGPEAFRSIASKVMFLASDEEILRRLVHDSLQIKRVIIEEDEFDTGLRNVLNYGHSFGHAIESATDYRVAHGIAITLGMAVANHVAKDLGMTSPEICDSMSSTLRWNYEGFCNVPIDPALVWVALMRDKKNTATSVRLILPNMQGEIGPVDVTPSEALKSIVSHSIEELTSS